ALVRAEVLRSTIARALGERGGPARGLALGRDRRLSVRPVARAAAVRRAIGSAKPGRLLRPGPLGGVSRPRVLAAGGGRASPARATPALRRGPAGENRRARPDNGGEARRRLECCPVQRLAGQARDGSRPRAGRPAALQDATGGGVLGPARASINLGPLASELLPVVPCLLQLLHHERQAGGAERLGAVAEDHHVMASKVEVLVPVGALHLDGTLAQQPSLELPPCDH